MMSPVLRPARSAGEPSVTEDTSTPVVSVRPKLFASSGVTGWMPTPSQPRVTLPESASWVTTFLARLMGMAKPIPTDPPLWEKIAVLMPMA